MFEIEVLEILKRVKNYAENETSLFIAIFTSSVACAAFFIRLLFYAYQAGYNFLFRIPNHYIRVSENILYNLVMAISVLVILSLCSMSAVDAMFKRKLLKHFLNTFCISSGFLLFVSFCLDGMDCIQYVQQILLAGLYVTFICHMFAIADLGSLSDDNKRKRYKGILEEKRKKRQLLIKKRKQVLTRWKRVVLKCEVKWYLCGRKSLNKKIRKLDKRIGSKSVNSIPKGRDVKKLTALVLAMLAIAVLGIAIIGCVEGSKRRQIKVIGSTMLDSRLNGQYEQYAVLHEDKSVYLIAPCVEDGEYLKLIVSQQAEIDRKDVLAARGTYRKILIYD